MRLQDPLAVVTPTVDGDVLSVLALARRSFTVGELHRLLGRHSHSGVRKVLLRLESQGILDSERVGNVITYRFNDEHLAAGAIVALAGLRSTFLEKLTEALRLWSPPARFASLFGSAARGEMIDGSDIDLFLVRDPEIDGAGLDRWAGNVQDLQTAVARWTGNDVRVVETSVPELIDRGASDPLVDAIRREGVVVAGSSDFWRVLRGQNR